MANEEKTMINLTNVAGPFWGARPTTSTTTCAFGHYYLHFDDYGRIIAIEWI